jgi:hypothetical protein
MMFDPKTLLMLAMGVLLLMNGVSARSFGFGRGGEERASEPDASPPASPASELSAFASGDAEGEAGLEGGLERAERA